MLQFIAQTNDRYSVAETIQMAIEGGCRWIQLHLPDLSDDDIRQMAGDIIDMCRDAAAFLMLEDRPGLAKELGLHGVHFKDLGGRPATAWRQDLGPEAVIGVQTDNAEAVMALRNADIDYVTLPPEMKTEKMAGLIAAVREAGIELPVVATGDITPDDVPVYMAAGVSGIATSKPIIDSADPVHETELTIAALNDAKQE